MAKTQIPNLPVGVGLDGSEQLPVRDGAGDVKYTVDALSNYTKSKITDSETLAHVIAANPQINGLNANLLQGLLASHFTNASNLSSGVVADARLPSGSTSPTWTSGGVHPTDGSFKDALIIPEFVFGARIMFQHGWSIFVYENQSQFISFKTPFASGWGTENTPNVFVTANSRCETFPSVQSPPYRNIEVQAQLYGRPSLSGFSYATNRVGGSGADTVRINWWAIGTY